MLLRSWAGWDKIISLFLQHPCASPQVFPTPLISVLDDTKVRKLRSCHCPKEKLKDMNWWHPLNSAVGTWNHSNWVFFPKCYYNLSALKLVTEHLWKYRQGHENSSDPISVSYSIYRGWGFFSPGRYLAKRTKVGRFYCNGSVSKNSAWLHSCTARVCQNNPMPAWTNICASYSTYTHSYKFYRNKKKSQRIRNGCLLEISTYVAAQSALGRFCCFYKKTTPSGVNTMFAWGIGLVKLLAMGKRQIAWGARLWKLHNLMVFEL